MRFRSLPLLIAALCSVLFLFPSASFAASNGKYLYSFTGGNDGGAPHTALSFDSSGNAYGVTVTGGASDCGTVFQLSTTGVETPLFAFDCFSTGKNPYGGVIIDSKGNLYGTTVAGGDGGICAGDGCGVVYMLSNSGGSWTETVLYNFTGLDDGFGPGGALIMDASGNLYGTTPDGGSGGVGVIYELSPKGGQWVQTVLHAFTGGDDGAVGSLGPLLLDHNGNIDGVTELGGKFGAGTVFQLFMARGQWSFSTLYSFRGQPDAAFPYGGVIEDPKGNLYGTTYFGGASGVGAVFQLDLAHKREHVLYSFAEGNDGGYSTSSLIFDSRGNLYGTTSMGGNPSCDCGTVFELSPAQGGVKERILHRFSESPDGGYPYYGLTSDGKGNFYGSTVSGGHNTQGVIFSFKP